MSTGSSLQCFVYAQKEFISPLKVDAKAWLLLAPHALATTNTWQAEIKSLVPDRKLHTLNDEGVDLWASPEQLWLLAHRLRLAEGIRVRVARKGTFKVWSKTRAHLPPPCPQHSAEQSPKHEPPASRCTLPKPPWHPFPKPPSSHVACPLIAALQVT